MSSASSDEKTMAGRRLAWSVELRRALETLLLQANGRRKTRVLTWEDVERCAEAALHSELGFAWANAGPAPDARELTTVCLCTVVGGPQPALTLGVKAAHGAATPANAWQDITSWDRFQESANAAACFAWAGRVRGDRLTVPLVAPVVTFTASHQELLGAVLANPDDEGPRLVFADWLSERADPRGEFISIQCQLAGNPPRRAELEAREASLLSEHDALWLGGHGADVMAVRFARGFAQAVEILDSQALPRFESFFRNEPVTQLTFHSSRLLDGARFAALEWAQRLHTLSFRAARLQGPGALSIEQLGHLLASRRFRRLRRLELFGQRLGDSGLALLAQHGAKTFPNLEALVLENDAVTAKGVEALAQSRWAGRFIELSLSNNALRAEGAQALAYSKSPGRLLRLSLRANQLGDQGALILAGAPRFEGLRELSLSKNRIGATGIDALRKSVFLRQLTVLDLSGNVAGEK